MRRVLILFWLLMNSQTVLGTTMWEYGGVVGTGKTAIAVLKNTATGEKTFAAIGRKIGNDDYVVAFISRNRIILDQNGKKITLSSQGLRQDEKNSGNLAKPKFDADAHFNKLVGLGEKLVGTGELTIEQVNEMLSEEQQQWELIETMDAAIENTFGATVP